MGKVIQLNQFRKQNVTTQIFQNQTQQSKTSNSQIDLNPNTNPNLWLNGDKFIYGKTKNHDLFEIFMFQCDPKLRPLEASHNGLKDLKQIQEIFPKDLEDTIKSLQNSKLYFPENQTDKIYDQDIKVYEDKITNHLITQYKLNISQITTLGYTRFFELFCDRYNNTQELDSDFQAFTKDEIRYLAIKENNQNVLQTISKFPKITQNNLEEFLNFWDNIMFNDDINTY